jgi:hypothetical protein
MTETWSALASGLISHTSRRYRGLVMSTRRLRRSTRSPSTVVYCFLSVKTRSGDRTGWSTTSHWTATARFASNCTSTLSQRCDRFRRERCISASKRRAVRADTTGLIAQQLFCTFFVRFCTMSATRCLPEAASLRRMVPATAMHHQAKQSTGATAARLARKGVGAAERPPGEPGAAGGGVRLTGHPHLPQPPALPAFPAFPPFAAALPGLISTPSSQVARPPSGSAATTRMR